VRWNGRHRSRDALKGLLNPTGAILASKPDYYRKLYADPDARHKSTDSVFPILPESASRGKEMRHKHGYDNKHEAKRQECHRNRLSQLVLAHRFTSS
jgi:hypothetical protein